MKKVIEPIRTKAPGFLAAIITAILLVTASCLFASPAQLLSTRSPSVAYLPGGNGDSVAPWISTDGRFVVFSSLANDLTPGGNSMPVLNVYLRDRNYDTTVLVSANTNGTGGGNGHSTAGQASAYGRYVVFQSDASDLVAGDTNGVTDIFLRDTYTGRTILISVAMDGGFANGASTDPVMTPDGTSIAFVSAASSLVAGDTNGIPDVFVRDLIPQTTSLASVGATGTNTSMATPAITPDGRFVAFFSTATNLAAGVSPDTQGEIYVRDRLAGTTIWASTNATATLSNMLMYVYMFAGLSNASSVHPVISDNGRYVAFRTGWTNLIVCLPPTMASRAPAAAVLQYDTVNGTTTTLTTNGYPIGAYYDDFCGPAMTPDGRYIAYVECEQNTSPSYYSVRLWDRLTGTNVLVSAGPDGLWLTNSTSHTPAVSQDGRYVTFLSDATNLVSNTVSNGLHVYRRDLQTATTVLLDANTNGVGVVDKLGVVPVLSADGSCVAYATRDDGLICSDNNNAQDIFLWNAATATNTLISVHNPLAALQSGNLASTFGPLSVSANGQLVAFASFASDLVPNDFNGAADVFVRDLWANSNILISVGMDGNSGRGGPSFAPTISADGRYVVFVSAATNLVAGSFNGAFNVFRRDLQSGTTELVNVSSGGINLYGPVVLPASSQDGRYIAYYCTNLFFGSPGAHGLFWKDMNTGVTNLVFANSVNYTNRTQQFTLSADGRCLAFIDTSGAFSVWDAITMTNIYTNTTYIVSAAAISPKGNRLIFQTGNQLFVRDLPGTTNLFHCPSTIPLRGPSRWSGDGRYVAFVTETNLVAGDNNGTNDVYLLDAQTLTLTLVSVNQSGIGSAAGPSDWPVVSTDGRFVVFRSFATDVAPGVVNPPSLIVFDRLSGTNRLLATGTTGAGWTTWVSQPALSTDGSQVEFQSWDAGLVSGDLNGAGDTFATALNGGLALDSDADSIPDWWTILYFGHPTGQASDLSQAQDDADGNGMSNLQKYLAGLNPIDPNSILAVSIVPDVSGTNAVLSWAAVAGKNYQLLSTTDLSNQNWQAVPGTVMAVPGSVWVGGSRLYLTVQPTNAQCYYRVQCN